MRIEGRCHCGNIRYVLNWPGDGADIKIRACGCAFCTKHGGSWISHRESELVAEVHDASGVSKYRFGTSTADFYVCSRCGVVPFVTSAIDDHLYAVVNVNTFDGIDRGRIRAQPATFEGEDLQVRLERRRRNWIAEVILSEGGS